MTTYIDAFWATRVVPPSVPNSHPFIFQKPTGISIKSAVTSTSSSTAPSPSMTRSTSSSSTSSADLDDQWAFGTKTIPLPDAPYSSSTVTKFVEMITMPLVRDAEDPTKWVVEKYKAPLDKFVSPTNALHFWP